MRTTQRKEMSPQRVHVFQSALASRKLTPDQYRKLADVFESEGLNVEADLLRKRARLRELPPDIRRARADVFRKAMSSTNPDAVETLAAAYEEEGATGSAKTLRVYALSLRNAGDVEQAENTETEFGAQHHKNRHKHHRSQQPQANGEGGGGGSGGGGDDGESDSDFGLGTDIPSQYHATHPSPPPDVPPIEDHVISSEEYNRQIGAVK